MPDEPRPEEGAHHPALHHHAAFRRSLLLHFVADQRVGNQSVRKQKLGFPVSLSIPIHTEAKFPIIREACAICAASHFFMLKLQDEGDFVSIHHALIIADFRYILVVRKEPVHARMATSGLIFLYPPAVDNSSGKSRVRGI